MMGEPFALSGLILSGLLSGGWSSHPESTLAPPQTIEMDEKTLEKFREEVEEYVRLRRSVLTHIPPARPSSGEELAARQRSLTEAIVAYRKGKKRGNMFRSRVEAAIRRTLMREFDGPDGPGLIKAVKQGNPKVEGNPVPNDPTKEVKVAMTLAVNAVYPDPASFSTVPPSLLSKLPPLPEEVRYRFVGRALILRDTEANVILDFIPDIVPDRTIPR